MIMRKLFRPANGSSVIFLAACAVTLAKLKTGVV